MSGSVRRMLGIQLLAALGLAIIAASAPQLHERIHADATRSNHQCAITLLVSGACEQAGAPQIVGIVQSPPAATAILLEDLRLVVTAVRSSILEHAPPACS